MTLKFNLVHDPWIKVLDMGNAVMEVSLSDLFRNATSYRRFAGESEPQDIAVMRVCLAVMYAALAQGVDDQQAAEDLWESIWSVRQFPHRELLAYLDRWKDRFYLVHPTHPFYQRPCAAGGTGYNILKLNGNLCQSGDKVRFFTESLQDSTEGMLFPEAARWLIYLNAFDDNSGKPSSAYSADCKARNKATESVGAGWLGRCGLVFLAGENLFQTLMLNFVLLMDGKEPYGTEKPCWELDVPRDAERTTVPCPDNPAELYTFQSRRIILDLNDTGDRVVGYHTIGGDVFDPVNAFIEPMTIWQAPLAEGNDSAKAPEFRPRTHRPQERFWRTMPGLLGRRLGSRRTHVPGILTWVGMLSSHGILEDIPVHVRMVSVQYGDAKCFNVADTFSDGTCGEMRLSALLSEAWRDMISETVSVTVDTLAGYVWQLGRNVAEADGMEYTRSGSSPAGSFAAAQQAAFYDLAGREFRTWLSELDPGTQDCAQKGLDIKAACVDCARQMPSRIVGALSPQALFGRPGRKASVAGAVGMFDTQVRRFSDGSKQ